MTWPKICYADRVLAPKLARKLARRAVDKSRAMADTAASDGLWRVGGIGMTLYRGALPEVGKPETLPMQVASVGPQGAGNEGRHYVRCHEDRWQAVQSPGR